MGFSCHELSMVYRTRKGETYAISDVSFAAGEHEFVCIVGPSGCGKTTLLKLISGLIEPTGGHISFATGPVNGQPRTAMVFQDHALFPWMTVLDNVSFGLETRGVDRRTRHRKALAFIKKVGLGDFAGNYPFELSVGMRQRAGIARALLANPSILLMDEPFGSLDAQTKKVLQRELLSLWREEPKTVVYVTHDIEEALLLGDRILVMTGRPGCILEDISVPLGRPRHHEAIDSPELLKIKWNIWKLLEKEVQGSLGFVSGEASPGADPA